MFVYRATQKFFDTLRLVGGIFKAYCSRFTPIKDNEINMFDSDVHNLVSYTGSQKCFLTYYGLCLETAGNIF